MSRPGEHDRDAVDRAFADLVAGWHLTADRPNPSAESQRTLEPTAEPLVAATETDASDAGWADQHPLFRYSGPPTSEERPEPEPRFVPEPPPALPRPGWPALLAWLAMGYAVLAVLAAALGVRLPTWAGWCAVVGFIGGFGVLLTRLPRHRSPDAGDGAVL